MRCLYCGKELALLKRLRGGGEFCSEAHRQQYQEEYNQLALNRLLQAGAAPQSTHAAQLGQGSNGDSHSPVAVETIAVEAYRNGSPSPPSSSPREEIRPLPVVAAPAVEAEPEPARLAGFQSDRPQAHEPAAPTTRVSLEPVAVLQPVFPSEAAPIPVDFEQLRGAAQPPLAGRHRLTSARLAGVRGWVMGEVRAGSGNVIIS